MRKMLFGYNFGKLSIAIIPASQAKANREDWVEIDPASLNTQAKAAYEEYKNMYRQAKAAREEFERLMRNEAGLANETKTVSKAATPKQSLGDYLKAMAQR